MNVGVPVLALASGMVLGALAVLVAQVLRQWRLRGFAEASGWDMEDAVAMPVGPSTKYILSTSGRPSSMRRYRALLRDVLDLDVAYLPFSGADDEGRIDARAFCAAVRGLGAIGAAISKDIKSTVCAELDELDALARTTGAVNTIARLDDGRLKGFNTDAAGFRAAVSGALGSRRIRRAVVYGYGGVTNVVVAVLRELGCSNISVTGRDLAAAADRAAELGVNVYDPDRGPPLDADFFVNAAPVTDAPLDQAPRFLDALQGAKLVFDHEINGAYLKTYCRQRGITHIPGSAMYWPQMVAQWRIFLAGRITPDVDRALLQKLQLADALATNSSRTAGLRR